MLFEMLSVLSITHAVELDTGQINTRLFCEGHLAPGMWMVRRGRKTPRLGQATYRLL